MPLPCLPKAEDSERCKSVVQDSPSDAEFYLILSVIIGYWTSSNRAVKTYVFGVLAAARSLLVVFCTISNLSDWARGGPLDLGFWRIFLPLVVYCIFPSCAAGDIAISISITACVT
jgi:hypothetical protein